MSIADADAGPEWERRQARGIKAVVRANEWRWNPTLRVEFIRDLMGPLRTEVWVDQNAHTNADVDKIDAKRWLAEDID